MSLRPDAEPFERTSFHEAVWRACLQLARTIFPRGRKPAVWHFNAYNAYTVELVLTRSPDLKSIRDLGSVFSSPWKKRFFTLLGQPRSLDDIEHGMIRAKGAYDDPRIHMAVNSASIGCPALRDDWSLNDAQDR